MKTANLRWAMTAMLGIITSFTQTFVGQAQESIIPPPGVPGTGYYASVNDAPAMAPQAVTSMQPSASPIPQMDPALGISSASCVAPGSLPAGCNDCSELWVNACDPRPPGLLSRLLSHGRGGVGCDTGACDASIGCESVVDSCSGMCDASGGCNGGCGLWSHQSSVYASLLYLRPRNADVSYAVPIDGPIVSAPANNPIQIGNVGVVDPGFETGFFGGINLAVNSMTSIFAEVMIYDNEESDAISTTAPNALRSIVSHPSTSSVASDFLQASARLDLELESVDVGIRHLFVGGQVFAVNYVVGARYAKLDQGFQAEFLSNGTETVATNVDFEGIGPRIGFEAERQSCRSRFGIYTRGSASFLAGRFQADYFQGQSFDPTVVDTYWEAGRVVPVLDFELGGGWTSESGRLRLSAGYLVSSWFNTVKTEDFIRSVQNNDFIELHDSITFDGVRVAAELRF